MTIDAEALEKAFQKFMKLSSYMVTKDELSSAIEAYLSALAPIAIQGDESREPEGSLEVFPVAEVSAGVLRWRVNDADRPHDALLYADKPHTAEWHDAIREVLEVASLDANGKPESRFFDASEINSRTARLAALSAQSSPSASARQSSPPLDGAGIPEGWQSAIEAAAKLCDAAEADYNRDLRASKPADSPGATAAHCMHISARSAASSLAREIRALSPPSQESRKANGELSKSERIERGTR